MSAGLKATGAWAAVTADAAVTLVGSPAAGDRYFLWASWKDFAITADVSGWTEIAEYADGAVTQGDGTGSMKVACWYRDWQSGDGNPTIDFSSSPSIAGHVMQLWQKNSGETWDTPVYQTGNRAGVGTGDDVTSGAAGPIPGGVVMCCIGIRDDSATFSRPTNGIDGSITWLANYVESPATHLTTTTGNDMAADLGYRLVLAGSASAALSANITATTAAETGAALWVTQNVTGPPISSIIDNFDSGFVEGLRWAAADWSTNDPALITVVAGAIRIEHPATTVTNTFGRESSLGGCDYTSSAAFVEVTDFGNQTLVSHQVIFMAHFDFSNQLYFIAGNNQLFAYKKVAGTQTQIGSAIALSGTAHRWWKIREAAGTIFFDTSPDASTWTNRWSVANPFVVTSLYPLMRSNAFAVEASGSFAIFDNFNTAAAHSNNMLLSVAVRRAGFY